jgi:hypothetical protein
MVSRTARAIGMLGLLALPRVAAAQQAPRPAPQPVQAPAPSPSEAAPGAVVASSAPSAGEIHHAPVSFARVGEPIRVRVTIEHPELVRRAILVYRPRGGELVEVPFERAPEGPYAAIIPKAHVQSPAIGYAIELEGIDGQRRPSFASRTSLHSVQVAEERMDAREAAALARIDGRRSLLSAQGDYVSFGESQATVADGAGGAKRTLAVGDRYFRIEGAYTYRLLRTVSAFGIRVGVVRGQSPVPGAARTSDFDVGLNYGAPNVQFRVADIVHLDAQLLTSLTEEGFSGGAGGALHLGDVLGSELVLGFESIKVFGTRAFSRVDVAAAPRVLLSAVVEATNMPHASRYGVRLLGEVGFRLGGGYSAALRGGYQARDSASGGPSAGMTVGYAF